MLESICSKAYRNQEDLGKWKPEVKLFLKLNYQNKTKVGVSLQKGLDSECTYALKIIESMETPNTSNLKMKNEKCTSYFSKSGGE